MPSISYACAKKVSKTEQKYCPKDQKKDCCETKSCKKDHENNDCDGKCKHGFCGSSASSLSLSLPTSIDFKIINRFAEIKKQKFGFKQAFYSAGYSSIWQPPKIG